MNGYFYTHLRLPVVDFASYQPLSESTPPYVYPAADGCFVDYLPVQRCWPALLDKGGLWDTVENEIYLIGITLKMGRYEREYFLNRMKHLFVFNPHNLNMKAL